MDTAASDLIRQWWDERLYKKPIAEAFACPYS